MLIIRRSNCINTASGIVILKISEWSKITKIQFAAFAANCILVILYRNDCSIFVCKRDTNERTRSEFNFATIYWFKLTPSAPKVVMYRVPNDQHFKEV